ncbi:MAG: hypothetical protein WBP22_05545 [Candidatus Saccharimonas sp.]
MSSRAVARESTHDWVAALNDVARAQVSSHERRHEDERNFFNGQGYSNNDSLIYILA